MPDEKVCGTCRWHKRDGEDWICANTNCEHCSDYTDYSYSCDEWEERT